MNLRLFLILCLAALATGGCARSTPDASKLAPTPQLEHPVPLPPERAVLAWTKLQRPQDAFVQNFGETIALGENILAVGAPDWNDMPGKQQGRVFVYRRDGDSWVKEATLAAGDREDGFQYDQRMGTSLALQGDMLFAGAPNADDSKAGDNSGAVYIFQHGAQGWEQIDRLAAPEPRANAKFGTRLAASEESLVVGEGDSVLNLYIFHRDQDGWQQQALLEIPQVEAFKSYGMSFDIYGSTLAASVQYTQGEGEATRLFSRVYLYELEGGVWQQTSMLSFGEKDEISWRAAAGVVSLDGSQGRAERMALSGGKMSSEFGFASGAVMIYEREGAGWALRDQITAPDGKAYDMFGSGLDLRGNFLLVGVLGASEDSYMDGAAYLFEYDRGRWVEQLRLAHPEDGGFGDFFGARVDVVGSTLLISASDEFGNAVYAFEVGSP